MNNECIVESQIQLKKRVIKKNICLKLSFLVLEKIWDLNICSFFRNAEQTDDNGSQSCNNDLSLLVHGAK